MTDTTISLAASAEIQKLTKNPATPHWQDVSHGNIIKSFEFFSPLYVTCPL